MDSNAYLFYVLFAGRGLRLGIERAGLSLGLVTAGLDYNTDGITHC